MKVQYYYVYILTNFSKKVLYIGITNNLSRRVCEHYFNRGDPATFCGRYYCYWLIYYEEYESIKRAIEREKELKGWKRFRKHELIQSENAGWRFLNAEVCEFWPPNEENTS